jgi:ABC-2 type transport system permease protein
MFAHNFLYTLKILLGRRSLVFWTMAFPLILATLFYLAFSNFSASSQFEPIRIAVVRSEEKTENSEIFESAIATLSDPDQETQVFKTHYTTAAKAKQQLADNKIAGYIISGDQPSVHIKENGIEQTILKSAVDEILVDTDIIQHAAAKQIEIEMRQGNPNPDVQSITQEAADAVLNEDVKIKDISGEHLDPIMVEFYTLLAMVCMYSGTIGMEAVSKHQANVNAQGKRTSITGVKKSTLVFSSALASWLIQLAALTVVFLFTYHVLHIDYGTHWMQVILLTCVGSLAGLCFGIFVCTLPKISQPNKDSLIITLTMVGSFLSGMMGVDMKYFIDKNMPLVNKLNPVAMITDGYYALYTNIGAARFYEDLFSLLIFSGILLVIAIFGLRRQTYDSL